MILGAGVSGLSLGKYLSQDSYKVHVLEKNKGVGGIAGGFKHAGHELDFGPHKLYSQLPGLMDEFVETLGKKNTLKVKKRNSLFLLGNHFDFPIKIFQVLKGINPFKSLFLGLGFGFATLKNLFSSKKPKTYEDYFIKGFGKPAYELLFKGYAQKVWGSPKRLSEELGRKRVPAPNILNLLTGKQEDAKGQEISAKFFYYPKRGGVKVLSDAFVSSIKKAKGTVTTDIALQKIEAKHDRIQSITYKQGRKSVKKNVDFLASTIYLQDLLKLLSPKPPIGVLAAAQGLEYRGLILVFITVKKRPVMKDNWVFFPEKKYVFNRISEHNSFNPDLVKEGTAVLTAEITCPSDSSLYNSSDNYLFRRVIDDLESTGILSEDCVVDFVVKKAKRVYPVYDLEYRRNLAIVLRYLSRYRNLLSVGRQGLYNYNNIDHCMDMSRHAKDYVDAFFAGASSEELEVLWQQKMNYFDAYKIVD